MKGFILSLSLLFLPALSIAGTYVLNVPSNYTMKIYTNSTARSSARAKVPGGSVVTYTGTSRGGWKHVSIRTKSRGIIQGWMYDGPRDYLKQVTYRSSNVRTEASSGCVNCRSQSGQTTQRMTVGRGAFANYHRNPKVAGMINNCIRTYGPRNTKNLCLQGVRISGQTSGLLSKSTNLTAWSSTAGTKLREQGFINLLEDPSYRGRITSPNDQDIPIGAILIYDGTNAPKNRTVRLGQGIGHAEIKTSEGRFCSDYTTSVPGGAAKIRSTTSMQGGTGRRKRRLKGVWVKPGLGV